MKLHTIVQHLSPFISESVLNWYQGLRHLSRYTLGYNTMRRGVSHSASPRVHQAGQHQIANSSIQLLPTNHPNFPYTSPRFTQIHLSLSSPSAPQFSYTLQVPPRLLRLRYLQRGKKQLQRTNPAGSPRYLDPVLGSPISNFLRTRRLGQYEARSTQRV